MRLIWLASLFFFNLQLFANDIASYGNKKVTEEEFKKVIETLGPRAAMVKSRPESREQFLENYITLKILTDEAKSKKLDNSNEYKEQMQFMSGQILSRLYMEDYIEKNSNEAAMKEYYKKNADSFIDQKVCASHILFKQCDDKKAKDVLASAKKKDANFAELAKKHSEGPSNTKGGDLGCFGKGRMVKEFEDAAFKTKPGTVHSELVKSQFGCHIIKVSKIEGDGKAPKFETVKDKVKDRLQRELRTSHLEDLKKQAKVKIDKEKLQKMNL